MSDAMLFGILRMPFDLAMADEISRHQYWQRGQYAAHEIQRLRAKVEQQAQHIERLQSKIDAERSCACSYDAPGDVCAAHSPALAEARAQVERLRAAATSAGAALAAAIDLLERGRRAAPSKRMFSQMLSDYRATVARTRKALEDGR